MVEGRHMIDNASTPNHVARQLYQCRSYLREGGDNVVWPVIAHKLVAAMAWAAHKTHNTRTRKQVHYICNRLATYMLTHM